MQKTHTRRLVQLALFTALELIFCFTPLGSIPITPGIVVTLAHIPALIAAIALGYKAATFIGAVMGISSLIVWSFMPPNPATAFVFSPFTSLGETKGNFMSLVICIVPRVLFPILAVFLYRLFKKKMRLSLAAGLSSAIATLAHTVMVLGLIYLSFHNYPGIGNSFIPFIIAWAGVNAIVEIISAAIVSAALAVPLSKIN